MTADGWEGGKPPWVTGVDRKEGERGGSDEIGGSEQARYVDEKGAKDEVE